MTANSDAGVDVEWLGRPVGWELARSVLFDTEYLQLQQVPGAECAARTFLGFWTLKEAYLKACGLGLSRSPEDFSFSLSPCNTSRIHFTERVPDAASCCRSGRT
jgi:4'-phosphopantetheinyl transferase